MPKLGGQLYQIDQPLMPAGRNIWQMQLTLIIVPLLIVVAYCSVYIQFRMHQAAALSKATHAQHDSHPSVGDLPSISLTTQSKLPVVPTTSTTNQQTTTPQSSSTSSSLQSSHDNNDWPKSLSVSRGNSSNKLILPTPTPTPSKSQKK